MRVWRALFAIGAVLYLVGILAQVFLAGAGLFGLTDWGAHTELGWGLGTAGLLVLVLTLAARAGRDTAWLSVGLAISSVVQPTLAEARSVAPMIAALHPVNALLLFWLAWIVARRSIGLALAPGPGPASAVTERSPTD